MNLWDKVATTRPGSFAHMIGALLYDHSNAIEAFSHAREYQSENWHAWLNKLQHYLEEQAYEELKKEAEKEPWLRELDVQLKKGEVAK